MNWTAACSSPQRFHRSCIFLIKRNSTTRILNSNQNNRFVLDLINVRSKLLRLK